MLVLIVEIWAKFEPKIAKNYQKVPKKRLKIDLFKSSRQKSTWSQSWEIDLTRLNSTDSEHYLEYRAIPLFVSKNEKLGSTFKNEPYSQT